MKKVCATYRTGGYGNLNRPIIITPGWEYICFTDDDTLESDVWKIMLIEDVMLDPIRLARKSKIITHEFIDYDLLITCDITTTVNCNLDSFIETYKTHSFVAMRHNLRDCIYEEATACIERNKDNPTDINEYMSFLKLQGYPEHNGLIGSGVIIKDNTEYNRRFCRSWWKEVWNYTCRDQLSFNYIAWKLKMYYDTMPFDILKSEFLLQK